MRSAAICIIISFLVIIQFACDGRFKSVLAKKSSDNSNHQLDIDSFEKCETPHDSVTETAEDEKESRLSSIHRRRREALSAPRRQWRTVTNRRRSGRNGKLTIHACGAALYNLVNEVCASFTQSIGSSARFRRALPESTVPWRLCTPYGVFRTVQYIVSGLSI